jgi:hypothetical protein
MGEEIKVYKDFFVVKRQGTRPFGRPKRRWENEIRMYVKEMGWVGVWSVFI